MPCCCISSVKIVYLLFFVLFLFVFLPLCIYHAKILMFRRLQSSVGHFLYVFLLRFFQCVVSTSGLLVCAALNMGSHQLALQSNLLHVFKRATPGFENALKKDNMSWLYDFYNHLKESTICHRLKYWHIWQQSIINITFHWKSEFKRCSTLVEYAREIYKIFTSSHRKAHFVSIIVMSVL